LDVPAQLGFDAVANPISGVMSGAYQNLSCTSALHVVNDTWVNNFLQVKCEHSGSFESFNS
jgi:hypothetical protein